MSQAHFTSDVEQSFKLGSTTVIRHDSGFYFDSRTNDAIKSAIVNAHAMGTRVRVFYGDDNGASWHEENDVIGTIGRSSGKCKIPLLIANSRSSGGGSLLDHCIVAMIDTKTGRMLYKHPSFSTGTWSIAPAISEGYLEAAMVDGKLNAQFKKPGQAARYIGFMRGERFSK